MPFMKADKEVNSKNKEQTMKILFGEGDRVMLRTTLTESKKILAKFIGGIYEVSAVKRMYDQPVYELKGVESPFGIPYTIHSDWLVPVKEIEGGKVTE